MGKVALRPALLDNGEERIFSEVAIDVSAAKKQLRKYWRNTQGKFQNISKINSQKISNAIC